jgi:hypothetical protein
MRSTLALKFSFCVSVLIAISFVITPALAQQTGPEMALTRTASDSDLEWLPCPAFLPDGCGIAVLHGNPAEDNLDVFFRVPGKSTLPLHWHTSAERMVLVAGELHVTYEGQPVAILRPGTYAYGPASRPHHGFCASVEACVLFIAFESPLDAISALD